MQKADSSLMNRGKYPEGAMYTDSTTGNLKRTDVHVKTVTSSKEKEKKMTEIWYHFTVGQN